jgi:hypothetical protein
VQQLSIDTLLSQLMQLIWHRHLRQLIELEFSRCADRIVAVLTLWRVVARHMTPGGVSQIPQSTAWHAP